LASEDEGGGFQARCASSSKKTELRASGIARRRMEEEGAEA